MEKKKDVDIFKRTAILSLIIYFPILFALLIPCIVLGIVQKNWTYTYAWLVCLGPCSAFVLISALLPIEKILALRKKKLIFAWTLLYIFKYILLFIVPIMCVLYGQQYFNKWIMLSMTIFTPIMVFIMKMIVVYSKKNKATEPQNTNTIKF